MAAINSYTIQESNILHDDPLTLEDKQKIEVFVKKHLLSDETVSFKTWSSSADEWVMKTYTKNVFAKHLGGDRTDQELDAIQKPYDSHDPEGLQKAQAAMGQKKFEEFRQALKHPEVLGLGKNPHAVQRYMRAVIHAIKNNTVQNQDAIQDHYRIKMAAVREQASLKQAICGKAKLLLQNDPVLPNPNPRTPLEAVLANTHFRAPRKTFAPEIGQAPGQEPIIIRPEIVFTRTREETRETLRKCLQNLHESPKTKHVIDALGTVILKEKGQIFFSSITEVDDDLGAPYKLHRGAVGFYNTRHTLIMSSIIDPCEEGNRVNPRVLSTFIHESLHFIFNRIVNNYSSPVKSGSPEEALLDKALESDRNNRPPSQGLTRRQRAIHQTLVDELEDEKSYFPGGFIPTNTEHQHKMRVEAIVRVMQEITDGATEEDFKVVAPKLYEFYMTHSKPMIEKYIQDNLPN